MRSFIDKIDYIENFNLYEGLSPRDVSSVLLWESAGHAIREAALTTDQIQQLFQQVEQGAGAAGGNRTLLGQGKDAASAVNKAWEDLKTKVQNSGPIKSVDAAYDLAAEKLKTATGGDAGVMKYVQKYRDFAKKYPISQSLIYAALIAAAGISGAGLGGAAALGLFKMTDKLLQGEKFSSSAYAGAKTGATAYAAGQIGQALKGGDQASTGSAASAVNNLSTPQGVAKEALKVFKEKVANGEITDYNSYQQGMSDALNSVGGTVSAQSRIAAGRLLDAQLKGIAAEAAGGTIKGGGEAMAKAAIEALGGTAKSSVQAVTDAGTAVRNNFESVNLSTNQINEVFHYAANAIILEGVWDTIKNKAATVGKNLTTKVTADKLNTAWKKAGSPADSDAVAKILQDAGVDPALVTKTYADLSIPAPAQTQSAAPGVNTQDLLAQIMKLTAAEQQQVLAHLKK